MKHWVRAAKTIAWATLAVGILIAGCGEDTALVGGTCRYPYVECNLKCIDVATDSTNCGACGTVCAPGVACVGGVCGGRADGSTDGTIGDALGERGDGTLDAPIDGTLEGGDGGPGDGSAGDGSGGDGSAGDGSPGDGSPGDASGDGAVVCTPPLTRCGNECKDLQNDGDNCGVCGRVCASNICVLGVCQGAASGDIVYIGHDYFATPLNTSQARLLENAVLLAPKTPIRVLVYQRYAAASAVTRVSAILASAQARTGRTIQVTATSADATVTTVTTATYEVVLVHDQVGAPGGALATLGTSWAPALQSFTHVGGVVVMLDGANGTAQMPQLMTQTGLLSVTGHQTVGAGQLLELIAPTDGVGIGVISPFAMRVNTSRFATEANGGRMSWVVRHATSLEPNVVHKIAP